MSHTADQGYQVAKRVREAKHWMVRSGNNVIGPVSIELIERGLEAGKIPNDAEMSFAGRNQWRPVGEVFAPPAAAPPTPQAPQAPQPQALQPQVYAPQPQVYAPQTHGVVLPFPVPTPPVSYPEEPVSLPTQGMVASLFR